jgi:hypothetical protein
MREIVLGSGVKRAGLLALLVAASGLLAPAAQAATGSVTAKCVEGDFSGKFTLTYDIGTEYRLRKGTGAAGPYIADTGEMRVQVHHRVGTSQTTLLTKSRTGLRSDEVAEVPTNRTAVPRTGRAWVEVKFADSSGEKCTARADLR